MTWTKLGAEFPDEARNLSNAAYRLHVDALCYSNRLLSDLLISKPEVRRFSWLPGPDATETALKELVAEGWWEDRGSHWYIGARFAGWQRTKEQVEAKRSTDTKAQRRKRLHDAGDHSECLHSNESPSAHDNAHDQADDNATESSSFSERNGTAEKLGSSSALKTSGWGPVAVPGGCSVCHQPLVSVDGSTAHPTCELEAIA